MNVRLAIVATLVSSACGPDVGDANRWIPWHETLPPYVAELMQPPFPAAVARELRVATFNVHFAEDVPALAEAIRRNPDLAVVDILLLQEVNSIASVGQSRAAALAAALGIGFVFAPAEQIDGGLHGLAILSRFSIDHAEVMELPHANVHHNEHRRISVAIEIDLGTATLRVVNAHLDVRINTPERVHQLRPAIIDASDPVFVGGDFNTNPYVWAEGMVPVLPTSTAAAPDQAAALDEYMRALEFDTPTSGFGDTMDLGPFAVRLDSVYTRGLTTGDGAVERDVDYSDHWPLWLEIALP